MHVCTCVSRCVFHCTLVHTPQYTDCSTYYSLPDFLETGFSLILEFSFIFLFVCFFGYFWLGWWLTSHTILSLPPLAPSVLRLQALADTTELCPGCSDPNSAISPALRVMAVGVYNRHFRESEKQTGCVRGEQLLQLTQ